MAPGNRILDASYWRSRAHEAWTLAKSLEGAEPRSVMERVARSYEQLAEMAERMKQEGLA
jgi:hypothetical protein